jgi:hypothetical protein
MAPMPQEGQERDFSHEMKDFSKPAFRLQLPDGTFLSANSKAEMIEKMKDVRENIN